MRLTTSVNIELVSFAFIDIANNDDDNDDDELIIIILHIASPTPSTVTFCLIVPCISALTYLPSMS